MAFTPATFLPVSAMANSAAPRTYVYDSSDAIATIVTADYFLTRFQNLAAGDIIIATNGSAIYKMVVSVSSATTVTVQLQSSQELTVTGAMTPGVQSLELNHASTAVEATLATALTNPGLFTVVNTSASGTAAHTLTLTAGTFNGTNNVATLNAPKECLVVWFDSAGNGTIVENVGSVGLS